ncbi:MAG: TIM barrel protein [archaeon]
MDKLYFGTAGIPLSTKGKGTPAGIRRVKELGLGAMELEFVRGVHMKEPTAEEVDKVRKETGIKLTCHAPYYVNLNSEEKAKVEASKKRIFESARIANICGATSVTFHAAFYQKQDSEKVYKNVKKELEEIIKTLRKDGNDIEIRPELTGKATQFGNLDELIRLSQDIEGVLPCIDFAHMFARTGKFNSYVEFMSMLEKIEVSLGKKALQNMHCHVSGIEFTEKGERRHLEMPDSDFHYLDLAKAFKDSGMRGIVISESPNIELDALLMKKLYGQSAR